MSETEKNLKELGFLRQQQSLAEMFLFDLLLSDKIRLEAIPLELRANRDVYTAALRVSRNFHDRFVADVKIIMADVLRIAENPNSYLCKRRMSSIIDMLDTQIQLFSFERHGRVTYENFYKKTYKPFIKKLQKIFPGHIQDVSTGDIPQKFPEEHPYYYELA